MIGGGLNVGGSISIGNCLGFVDADVRGSCDAGDLSLGGREKRSTTLVVRDSMRGLRVVVQG